MRIDVSGRHRRQSLVLALLCALALFARPAIAQTAGDALAGETVTVEAVEPLSAEELETLVAPVALYPDDLLAIALPASAYPLQIVQAARFLAALEGDATLQPDDDWDDSVVALVNYPEIVTLMNGDLDWTWKLGEAVINQQSEVLSAVERFRQRAYAAGNLKSDEHQTVTATGEAIEIKRANPEVVYVPYYEPERVTVYQSVPVYYYYPVRRPVYYYPYPLGYAFDSPFFWGITSFYSLGWHTRHVHVHHHRSHGHPFYGHRYHGHHWRKARHKGYDHHDFNRHGSPKWASHDWKHDRHRSGARPKDHRRFDGDDPRRHERRFDDNRRREHRSNDVILTDRQRVDRARVRSAERTRQRNEPPNAFAERRSELPAARASTRPQPSTRQEQSRRQIVGARTMQPRLEHRSQRERPAAQRREDVRAATVPRQRSTMGANARALQQAHVQQSRSRQSQPRAIPRQSFARESAPTPRARPSVPITQTNAAPRQHRERAQPVERREQRAPARSAERPSRGQDSGRARSERGFAGRGVHSQR